MKSTKHHAEQLKKNLVVTFLELNYRISFLIFEKITSVRNSLFSKKCHILLQNVLDLTYTFVLVIQWFSSMCDVWCLIRDVPDLKFWKIQTLWVKERPTITHISSFKDFFCIIKNGRLGGNCFYTVSCKISYARIALKKYVKSN